MGISYNPILYLGREFNSVEEAEEFYELRFPVSYVEEKNMDSFDGFEEFISCHPSLSGTRTNYYVRDSTFVLGFNLAPYNRQPEMFPTAVYNKILEWKDKFGDEPYNIIHDVCIS